MKKGLVILLFAFALLITGCSDTGTLRITNWDAYDGWFTLNDGAITWLDAGYYYEEEYDLSTSIFGDEEKKITVEYGGEYVFTERVRKTVTPGSTAKVEFETNAGEIIVWNDSEGFYIYEVYLSPSSDTTWGINDLSGYIGPDEWVSWYVTTGFWDIKIIDDYGDEFVYYDQYIGVEETYWFYYNGFRKSSDPEAEKLENSKKYNTHIEDRVQQNDK